MIVRGNAWIWLLFVPAALVSLGCREELGPEPMLTTRVTGKVHLRGLPIGGGWVEFYPADGTVGKMRSAPLRTDGTFVADRVAVGHNAIKLVNPRPPIATLLPGGEEFERSTPILRDVAPDPTALLDIDLLDEYVRYVRERAPG
jgi:hypothetical protein